MSESWKRHALIAAGLLILLAGWRISRERPIEKSGGATDEIAGPAQPKSPAKPSRALENGHPGRVRSTRTNPVKAALRHSSWQIVSRKENDAEGNKEASAAEDSSSSTADLDKTGATGIDTTRLSLEFVRADFDAAGMRGIERFAAFSPPQFAAIKAALEKHPTTSISAAPIEFAQEGESINYELVNSEDDREFAVAFTPTPAEDKQTLQLRIATSGSTRRRDTTLPIWDGQTVMIPLARTPGTRNRLAVFVTVRLIDTSGKPANDFVVEER